MLCAFSRRTVLTAVSSAPGHRYTIIIIYNHLRVYVHIPKYYILFHKFTRITIDRTSFDQPIRSYL